MSPFLRKTSKFILPVAILVLAIGGAAGLAKLRPVAKKGGGEEKAPVVETKVLTAISIPAALRSTGVVEAARRVTLSPEVSGRVVWVSKNNVPGGKVTKGETLFRVDSRDYKTAIAQAKAQVAQATLVVTQEESRKVVAAKEWELLGDKRPEAEAALALRLPQLANARAQLAGAEANLARAELNASRTSVRAPFAGTVVSEDVEVGQVVTPAARLLTLLGTKSVWVRASIPVEHLAKIRVQDAVKDPTHATVILELGAGNDAVRWDAVAQRIAAEIDPETRSAQVIFSVADPSTAASMPLLPGTFVRLEIVGKPINDVVKIPRTGLSGGSTAWVVEDGKLAKRKLVVVWRGATEVAVSEGLTAGDELVLTSLSLPVEGMRVTTTAPTRNAKENEGGAQ